MKQVCKVPAEAIDRRNQLIRSTFPDSQKLNALINKWRTRATTYLVDCALADTNPDPEAFFKAGLRGDTLCAHIRSRADEFDKRQSFQQAKKIRSVASKIDAAGMDVALSKVDAAWVKKYDQKMVDGGNAPATRAKDMSVISAVLNELPGVDNPLKRYKKPKDTGSKAKLQKFELDALAAADLSGATSVARWAFLFAVYARGIRAFDLLTLRWSCIDGDQLTYTASKTKKTRTIEVTAAMREILDRFDQSTEYIFPIIQMPYQFYRVNKKRYEERVNRAAHGVNKELRAAAVVAKIRKHLTLHVARHTFAYLGDKAGIPLGTLMHLLDHSNIGTTYRYVQGLRHEDDLNEVVSGLF